MGSYFRPLRRKLGVITLSMACVLAVVWVRSFITFDGLSSPSGQLISSNGGIYFEILLEPFDFNFRYGSQGPNVKGRHDLYNDPKMVQFWRWRYVGFAYRTEEVDLKKGNGAQSTVTVVRFIVPYWSIVIPLTLLSARLLLRNRNVQLQSITPLLAENL